MSKEVKHKTLSPCIYSLRFWARLIDPVSLKTDFNAFLSDTGFKILNFSEHFFPVQGYTAVWLLAESHLAIHTFPEEGWSYIELSGCNAKKTAMFKRFIQNSGVEVAWETENPGKSIPNGFPASVTPVKEL